MGFGHPNIYLAAQIACKASFRKAYSYGLLKYRLGCNLHSDDIMDLQPFLTIERLSPFPDDHIRMLYAIILFYSVVEELGLEIRSSPKEPRFINDQWNPIIKQEWEKRAGKMGIDINNPISWNLRGTPTKIERTAKPPIISMAEWAGGSIRDCDINLMDAINQIGYIRNKIASHKMSKEDDATTSISRYDVANANFLARRLLLERFGYLKCLINSEISLEK